MSDTVPLFRFGDRVRVMQTPKAVDDGIANREGTVMTNQKTHCHRVWVAFDEEFGDCLSMEVSQSQLMRIQR